VVAVTLLALWLARQGSPDTILKMHDSSWNQEYAARPLWAAAQKGTCARQGEWVNSVHARENQGDQGMGVGNEIGPKMQFVRTSVHFLSIVRVAMFFGSAVALDIGWLASGWLAAAGRLAMVGQAALMGATSGAIMLLLLLFLESQAGPSAPRWSRLRGAPQIPKRLACGFLLERRRDSHAGLKRQERECAKIGSCA
jgi:hypothetical protein